MAACLRACLQATLKILNSVMGMFGMAIILYSLWMIRACSPQLCGFSRGFSEFGSSPLWFIYTFLGLGIFLCVLTCSGHVAAESFNHYCLTCYAAILLFLFILEASITAYIFLNRNWEDAFPYDPTGRFDQFKSFVGLNSELCESIGLLVISVQALSIFIAIVLRALGPEREVYDESDDDDSSPAALPLLKKYQPQNAHLPDRKSSSNNYSWIVWIQDKFISNF